MERAGTPAPHRVFRYRCVIAIRFSSCLVIVTFSRAMYDSNVSPISFALSSQPCPPRSSTTYITLPSGSSK